MPLSLSLLPWKTFKLLEYTTWDSIKLSQAWVHGSCVLHQDLCITCCKIRSRIRCIDSPACGVHCLFTVGCNNNIVYGSANLARPKVGLVSRHGWAKAWVKAGAPNSTWWMVLHSCWAAVLNKEDADKDKFRSRKCFLALKLKMSTQYERLCGESVLTRLQYLLITFNLLSIEPKMTKLAQIWLDLCGLN